MEKFKSIISSIGKTPLIRINSISEETSCEVYGKAEFFNPGGSVKDRAALFIIKDAADKGTLQPGGTIVEGTAGNTGIGLSLVANALGYRTKIVVPETQSKEKLQIIKSTGAELITVPAVAYSNPNHFVKYSEALANQLNHTLPKGAVWANQFDNLANRRAHIETTGPEIWTQTCGQVDGFVAAVGTGGTLAGTSMFLKSKKPTVLSCIADPPGAGLYSYFTKGVIESEGTSITEGIGQNRITNNLTGLEVDEAFRIQDQETLDIMFKLISQEGLFVGPSSGINVAASARLAKKIGPGKTIVTILCDLGSRYLSKIFDRQFLEEKNLKAPNWVS